MPSPPSRPSPTGDLSLRSRAALLAGRAVAGASRVAGMGTGSVIGGRVSLALDHDLLATLTASRQVALVSATNGKTTTTHLLATALRRHGPVVSNSLGANMPPGIVAALAEGARGEHVDPGTRAVLEVDERWLPEVLEVTARSAGGVTVLLGNLSRDQLDRSHEVRKIADAWRRALADLDAGDQIDQVVANADDPLVVWAAGGALPDHRVVWVGTQAHWTLDATGCPACGGRIEFDDDTHDDPGWRCRSCDFARPAPDWSLRDVDGPRGRGRVVGADGHAVGLALGLPGRVNLANAALALAAAAAMGAEPERVARGLATVDEVAGRYKQTELPGASGIRLRMLLAKNPAGWQEAIEMLAPPPRPVVCAINARIADGRDPSWLWDVPFERLAGRFVVALGERRHDLAVRLRYAEVDHAVADSLTDGVRAAVAGAAGQGVVTSEVDLIANYTAFQDYLDEVGRDERAGGAKGAGGPDDGELDDGEVDDGEVDGGEVDGGDVDDAERRGPAGPADGEHGRG